MMSSVLTRSLMSAQRGAAVMRTSVSTSGPEVDQIVEKAKSLTCCSELLKIAQFCLFCRVTKGDSVCAT